MRSYRGSQAGLNSLGVKGAHSPIEVECSRDHIVDDKVVAPYSLLGTRRAVCLILYILIVCSAFVGTLYCFYANPVFFVAILPVCYIVNNIAFLTVHSKLHASFIELPEKDMGVICHNSFIHHYRNIRIYHQKWLETRLAYFMDPRIVFDGAFIGFFVLLPLISLFLFLIDPILGIAFVSTQCLAQLLQATIHEWYHNPVSNRKNFYNPLVYWTFTVLEKLGVASTKRHLGHHRHNLHNLDEVDVWLDLWMPFGERVTSRLWKVALTKYIPGQSQMTRYVTLVGTIVQFIAFSVINPLMFVMLYKLFG
ncbi:hypothetical protein NKH93_10835 [Mesorhizobium sp. M0954]|uniref:hypothetical protein n=1 Tax=Mesorhizobium sp. M0954 TaxID=2957032 RepID=UPI0033382DB8